MGRLLIILENLRDFGGWDLDGHAKGMRWLAGLARIDWTGGRRRVFGNRATGQGGTNVWAQAVSYAATWLSAAVPPAKSWQGDVVPTNVLAETLDQIAIAQHVKCSPLGQRSQPNDSMWTECGRYVLREELTILQPQRLLVIGTGHNATAMRAGVLSSDMRVAAERTVKLGSRKMVLRLERANMGSDPGDMIVVPHPASPGGTSRALVRAVGELALERSSP